MKILSSSILVAGCKIAVRRVFNFWRRIRSFYKVYRVIFYISCDLRRVGGEELHRIVPKKNFSKNSIVIIFSSRRQPAAAKSFRYSNKFFSRAKLCDPCELFLIKLYRNSRFCRIIVIMLVSNFINYLKFFSFIKYPEIRYF